MFAESGSLPGGLGQRRARDKVTNDPLQLPGFDGRSRTARRFRYILHGILSELGGNLPEAVTLQARQVALASLRLEQLQQAAITGAEVDSFELVRQSTLVNRL